MLFFSTGAMPKGLILPKLSLMFACVLLLLFLKICVRTDFVDVENLWFDDLRAE